MNIKRINLGSVLALGCALLFVAPAFAQNQTIDGNEIITGNLSVQGNVAITGQLTNSGWSQFPKNLVDNPAMLVQQRGTGTATAATTAGCAITSYAADRWCADVNVTSGAGQLTPITSSPTPPTGFQQALKLVRNSGALTQPQCAWQEIPTNRVVPVAGQNVMLSANVAALAGLSADNGNAANLVIITGTGTDQGLGVLRGAVGMTASPAITPAWTGIATLQNTAITLTTSFARFNGAAVAVPSTVTEMAIGVCFTPTATGSGTTDGLAFTGVQLEVVPSTATVPSAFEFRPTNWEVVNNQRFFQILTEPASGVQVPVVGNSTSATAAAEAYEFPVVMDVAPTFTALGTALSSSTWTNKCGNVNNALATTFIVTATANTVSGASLTVTSSGSTIGFGCVLVGAGGGSILSWSADF